MLPKISKSTHIDITNKLTLGISLFMDGIQIPYANTAKYLGMTLKAKLRWNKHVEIKIMELQLKWKKVNSPLCRKTKLSIENKLLTYNQILKPI